VALDVGYEQLAVSYQDGPDEVARAAMPGRRRIRSDRPDEG
jgi:hypothetical protein